MRYDFENFFGHFLLKESVNRGELTGAEGLSGSMSELRLFRFIDFPEPFLYYGIDSILI